MIVALFFVNFIYIFLRAFQQLNVVHGNVGFIMPTSWLMGYCEVFIYGAVAYSYIEYGALQAILAGTAIGTGGGFGCLVSMYIHKRIRSG